MQTNIVDDNLAHALFAFRTKDLIVITDSE